MVKSTLGGSFTQNLSKLPRVDKSDQVASFVKQQERNARVYKAEGLRYVEVWGKENAYSSLSGAPGNPPRVEDGGGMEVMTPVLKARNPGCGLDIAQRQIAQEGRQDTMAKPDPPDPGAKVNAESSRLEKKGAKGVAERTKASPAKRSSKQTKAKNTGSPKKGRDAEKGSENTEERDRQTRMDQRKQRRKEKRDIVNPKKRKPASTDDDSDGSTQKKRAGKSKRQKVPAGLALMHGFSATNVGKSRLTVNGTYKVYGSIFKGKGIVKGEHWQEDEDYGEARNMRFRILLWEAKGKDF
ncbi:hypothetical protein EST38_g553 [Candolleomyces aberdarensis]|uniref:Uncharacterized protein n=1 Tax=Candolleomyces aberdarensis TaxID=2316362 RepID=A0A4V1Q5D6_9AGAR|nr:hypothetical protein EST38_g553 [Candolleomyces aberdarensis]